MIDRRPNTKTTSILKQKSEMNAFPVLSKHKNANILFCLGKLNAREGENMWYQVPKYIVIRDLGMNKIGYLLKYIPGEINSIAEAEITC